jgi:hypothetical protein
METVAIKHFKDMKYQGQLTKFLKTRLTKEEAEDLYRDIKDCPEAVLNILWTALNSRGDV